MSKSSQLAKKQIRREARRTKAQNFGLNDLNYFKKVGIAEFNTTQTSAVEKLSISREKIRSAGREQNITPNKK